MVRFAVEVLQRWEGATREEEGVWKRGAGASASAVVAEALRSQAVLSVGILCLRDALE